MEYLHLYAPPPPVAPKPKPKPTPEPQARKVDFQWKNNQDILYLHDIGRLQHLFTNKLIDETGTQVSTDYFSVPFNMFLNMILAPFQNDKTEIITKDHVLDAMKVIPSENKQEKRNERTIKTKLKKFFNDFPPDADAGAAT